jgi:uncharacterized protein (DUF4415 family)
MTAKAKKRKRRKARSRPGKVIELQASVEDDLMFLAEEEGGAEARWNPPRKRRISLRVDTEVVDWFKSKGPGYQTAGCPAFDLVDTTKTVGAPAGGPPFQWQVFLSRFETVGAPSLGFLQGRARCCR